MSNPSFSVQSALDRLPDRVVDHYIRQQNVSPHKARMDFCELLKFLSICASTPTRCAPSEAVDAVWHSFMQFTADYRHFCLTHFDCIIDHDPSPAQENIEPYIFTRQAIEREFGSIDPAFWPEGSAGAWMCGGNRAAA